MLYSILQSVQQDADYTVQHPVFCRVGCRLCCTASCILQSRMQNKLQSILYSVGQDADYAVLREPCCVQKVCLSPLGISEFSLKTCTECIVKELVQELFTVRLRRRKISCGIVTNLCQYMFIRFASISRVQNSGITVVTIFIYIYACRFDYNMIDICICVYWFLATVF